MTSSISPNSMHQIHSAIDQGLSGKLTSMECSGKTYEIHAIALDKSGNPVNLGALSPKTLEKIGQLAEFILKVHADNCHAPPLAQISYIDRSGLVYHTGNTEMHDSAVLDSTHEDSFTKMASGEFRLPTKTDKNTWTASHIWQAMTQKISNEWHAAHSNSIGSDSNAGSESDEEPNLNSTRRLPPQSNNQSSLPLLITPVVSQDTSSNRIKNTKDEADDEGSSDDYVRDHTSFYREPLQQSPRNLPTSLISPPKGAVSSTDDDLELVLVAIPKKVVLEPKKPGFFQRWLGRGIQTPVEKENGESEKRTPIIPTTVTYTQPLDETPMHDAWNHARAKINNLPSGSDSKEADEEQEVIDFDALKEKYLTKGTFTDPELIYLQEQMKQFEREKEGHLALWMHCGGRY